MKNAIIIHGAYGNPSENWYPWLKKELENKGLIVYTPIFPTPINQSFTTWENIIKHIVNEIDENTLIIAHSVGVPFILKIITKYQINISNVFLVSGFISKLDNDKFDKINKTFLTKIDWSKFNSSSPDTNIYHSDNDPYVNKSHALELSKKIPGSRLTIIKNAGHFNDESGYTKFTQLLQDIGTLL